MLREVKSAISFATYYPLLYRATEDSASATPGYVLEEIIKLSFISSQYRNLAVDFLIGRLQSCQHEGRQKVFQVLLSLSRRGHYEFRSILRLKDGYIREAISLGSHHEGDVSQTHQTLRKYGDELLALLFDPDVVKEDEHKALGQLDESFMSASSGYGVSSRSLSTSKYEGFGNTLAKEEGLAQQVIGAVEKLLVSTDEGSAVSLSTTNKGNYSPLPIGIGASTLSQSQFISSGLMGRSVCGSLVASTYQGSHRGYVAGKAGGGWDCDDDTNDDTKSSINKIITHESSLGINEPSAADFIKSHIYLIENNCSSASAVSNKCMGSHGAENYHVDFDDLQNFLNESDKFDQVEVLRSLASEIKMILYGSDVNLVKDVLVIDNNSVHGLVSRELVEENLSKRVVAESTNLEALEKQAQSIQTRTRPETLIKDILQSDSSIIEEEISDSNSKNDSKSKNNYRIFIILLFLEVGLYYQKFLVENIDKLCVDSLENIAANSEIFSPAVRTKARKIKCLIESVLKNR